MLKSHDEIVEEICNFDFEDKLWSDSGFDEFKTLLRTTLTARDAEVRELVEDKVKYLTDDYDTDEWSQAYVRGVKALEEHILTALNNNK